MTTIKAEGLPEYTPKRTYAVVGDAEAHYDARRRMALDHVLHIRGRTTDPWDDLDTKSLDGPLRRYYAELILEERNRFMASAGIGPAELVDRPGAHQSFWSDANEHRWEGWLCARLGFLPRTQ